MPIETINTEITNTPVSIVLGNGDSTTVPTGEVWSVRVVAWARVPKSQRDNLDVTLNGDSIQGCGANSPNAATDHRLVFSGGDTIGVRTENSGAHGAHITGFVINK